MALTNSDLSFIPLKDRRPEWSEEAYIPFRPWWKFFGMQSDLIKTFVRSDGLMFNAYHDNKLMLLEDLSKFDKENPFKVPPLREGQIWYLELQNCTVLLPALSCEDIFSNKSYSYHERSDLMHLSVALNNSYNRMVETYNNTSGNFNLNDLFIYDNNISRKIATFNAALIRDPIQPHIVPLLIKSN
jgi:hypothetical protein